MHSDKGCIFLYTHFGFRNAYKSLTQGRKSGGSFPYLVYINIYIYIITKEGLLGGGVADACKHVVSML